MLHGAKASRSSPRLFSILISMASMASMAMMVALADMGGARLASEAAAFMVILYALLVRIPNYLKLKTKYIATRLTAKINVTIIPSLAEKFFL